MYLYETLSEILLEKGLYDVSMLDLLALPESQDHMVQEFLSRLLEQSASEGEGDDDVFAVTGAVCAELERLWDEGIELLVDDGEVVAPQDFWRMLVMLPVLLFSDENEETVDGDECAVLNRESLVKVLQAGFDRYEDIPLEYSDFEAVLASMPEEVYYSFLMGLDDEARLRCLMRLAMAEDGWLFRMSEERFRSILLNGGSAVRNSMIQLLDGLGVEFTLEEGAPCDLAWAEACPHECDYCLSGACCCIDCCEGRDYSCENCPTGGRAEHSGSVNDVAVERGNIHDMVNDLPIKRLWALQQLLYTTRLFGEHNK